MNAGWKQIVKGIAAFSGVLLASSVSGNLIFSEDFEGSGGPGLIVGGFDANGWFQENDNQGFTGSWGPSGTFSAGSNMLWFDGVDHEGPYKPYSGTSDTAGITSTYGGFGGANGAALAASYNTGATFVNGITYDFSFTHFKRPDSTNGFAFVAEIYNATTAATLATLNAPLISVNNVFTPQSLQYTAVLADVGANIGVRFVGTGLGNLSVAGIDNITLSDSAVPEPSTIVLLGTGLGVLMAARRRFRKI